MVPAACFSLSSSRFRFSFSMPLLGSARVSTPVDCPKACMRVASSSLSFWTSALKRERERESVCVCVRERERERGRDRGNEGGKAGIGMVSELRALRSECGVLIAKC